MRASSTSFTQRSTVGTTLQRRGSCILRGLMLSWSQQEFSTGARQPGTFELGDYTGSDWNHVTDPTPAATPNRSV